MQNNQNPDQSLAEIIALYLTGKKPEKEILLRYLSALEKKNMNRSTVNDKISNFILKYPSTIAIIDAGLATTNKNHPLRQKILIMTAIIEASDVYTKLFFVEEFSFISRIKLISIVVKSLILGAAGYLFVKILRSDG